MVRILDQADKGAIDALAEVLCDCVEGGASVNFMAGFTRDEAASFWRRQFEAKDGRDVFVTEDAKGLCGVVMLIPASQPNQPHRADIAKMLVHRRARRHGRAEALLLAAQARAAHRGFTLLTLDTMADRDADRLYRRMGWTVAGIIPDYAAFPDGALGDTTFFYKDLRA
jgi:GNAT superfamily N-acetyltransferase